MFTGLGINYNYGPPGGIGDTTYQTELQSISNTGFKYVRLLLQDYLNNDPNYGIPAWKKVLEYALTLPFLKVGIGLSSNPTSYTASSAATFRTIKNSYATYLKGLGDSRIVYYHGNEETYHRDGSLTDAQVRANMRTDYAAIKAIAPDLSVTYAMANGEMFPFFNDSLSYPWDFASANLYSYPTNQTTATDYGVNVGSFLFWFNAANDCEITEFGPSDVGYAKGTWGDEDFYTATYVRMLKIGMEQGVSKMYIYNYMDGSNVFGVRHTNGSYRKWYRPLLFQNSRLEDI